MRSLRLVRLFRVAKLARYVESLQMLGRVFRSRKEELVSALTVLALLLCSFSTKSINVINLEAVA